MCTQFPYCVDMVLHCATIKQMVETDFILCSVKNVHVFSNIILITVN